MLSKVTTDLLKNEELGETESWRAMGTPNGEMQSPVRLDLFPMTKKATPVTFRNNKGNISGAEDQHYTARGDKFWNRSLFFSPKTSFIWKAFLIVKVASKLLSQLQFYGSSSFRDPSVQKYISKLIIKPYPPQKESAFRPV